MITSLINRSSLSTPFRGMANSIFDVTRSSRQEYIDVKNFASEIFNINVLKASLAVQALALELPTKLRSAACKFDQSDELHPRATKYNLHTKS